LDTSASRRWRRARWRAAAIPFFLLLRWAGSAWLEIVVCAAIVVAGAWSARLTERALGVEDPGPW